MIELFRKPDEPEWDLERRLQEAAVAHVVVEVDAPPPELAAAGPLPIIREGGIVVAGRASLEAYLEELLRVVEAWNSFQSDACYVEDDGSTC